MSELLYILERTISENRADQEVALNFLRQACETHYTEFVNRLATVLCTVDNQPYVRQAAGLQLKNTLYAKESEIFETYRRRWLEIPEEVRLYVKNCILQTLGTETRPSTAAQCVAAISCIELPENMWTDVIDCLMTNVTNPNSSVMLKESSLEAIGYICEDVSSTVMETKANLILTAIIHGMRADEEIHVRLAATNALLHSLEFTRNNFENEEERNIIMSVTCTTYVCHDTAVKVVALQCLVRIMSLYYQLMEPYMKTALFPITLEAMKSDIPEVALQGIEFWSNVCEEELNLKLEQDEAEEQGRTPMYVSKHYAKGALQFILPILTDTLSKQDENCDEDEWIPSKSAGVCIMFLAQCCGDAIIDVILPFITKHFISQNWHYKEAAIMAFGSILEGPSKEKLYTIAEQALSYLIQTLTDGNLVVKDTAAWAIGRICDTCETLVTKKEILPLLLPALFIALQDKPRVAANVCWAVSSLVKAAYQVAQDKEGEETFTLSNEFEGMVDELIKTADRDDANESNLRIAAYEALMELIKYSPNDCYRTVQKTTLIILEKLEKLLDIEDRIVSPNDRSQLRDVQAQLCATLQSVLQKINEEDALIISKKVMNGLLQIMNRCFVKDGGSVIEEALMAITALIEKLKSNFDVDSFKPYLFHALDMAEDSQVCITAIGVVSDLCRVLEGKICLIMDDIMKKLFSILQNEKAKRTVKTHVLSCFGDIALALNQEFLQHLEQCIIWISEAVNAANIQNPDDFDQVDYVENLFENCCSTYSGIVQALSKNTVALEPYFPIISQVVVKVATLNPAPSDIVTSNACALVGDLINAFGPAALPFLQTPVFQTLLERCHRSKNKKAETVANYVVRSAERVRHQT